MSRALRPILRSYIRRDINPHDPKTSSKDKKDPSPLEELGRVSNLGIIKNVDASQPQMKQTQYGSSLTPEPVICNRLPNHLPFPQPLAVSYEETHYTLNRVTQKTVFMAVACH